ncbi:Pyruvate phosphate dikinase, PEP/pyruvate-binding domain protein, partial [mine drainage metagenome]
YGKVFPEDVYAQLIMSIKAVFLSWDSERAKVYREINSIDNNLGTAVNIVSMIFGNMGSDSATGVAFTR